MNKKELKECHKDMLRSILNTKEGFCALEELVNNRELRLMEEADFHNADLEYANLSKANLENANLKYANLDSADMQHARAYDAELPELPEFYEHE